MAEMVRGYDRRAECLKKFPKGERVKTVGSAAQRGMLLAEGAEGLIRGTSFFYLYGWMPNILWDDRRQAAGGYFPSSVKLIKRNCKKREWVRG